MQGGGLRNYIHVNCAASVVSYILKQQLTGIFFGVSPHPISIEEMINLVSTKFKLPDPCKTNDIMISDSVVDVSQEIKHIILDFKEALNAYC